MCKFFSFITIPTENKYLYFDWKQRREMKFEGCDSHGIILEHYKVKTDAFNAYEYNPLTKEFVIDAINGKDDSGKAERWVKQLDFKNVVESLIIKPIVNPFDLPEASVTVDDIELLKQWDSVRDLVWASVRDSVWASVWDSVRASVLDSVWASVRDSVRDLVWDSARASVWAYFSSFFDIEYKYDYSPAVKLWERGLVASYDGTTRRLHTGKNAKVVYEWVEE